LKSLVTLQLATLHDAGLLIATAVDRDEQTILSRLEHEGESFLTITLPSFAKALEKGLRDGLWPRHDASSFRHIRGLPAFMRGFLTRVFSDDGTILDQPDVNSIWAVRQVCGLTGKLDRLCTPERERAAMIGFIQTDRELGAHFDDGISADLWEAFERHAFVLFGEIFNTAETSVSHFELLPSHGPGAVADRLDHAARWDFGYWPQRLEDTFPRWRYTRNLPYWDSMEPVPTEDEIPVRVISVPKTQAKPRIIAIEPSAMQYAQQGLKELLYREVEKSHLREILGFTDQTRNQRMAHSSSISGSFATLDLSEASDRVHLEMVSRLLSKWPHLRDFVMATRSRIADVQGEVITLNKFASMGSALTFPLEAIIFTVITSMGVSGLKAPVPARQLAGRVSVYGDDIIAPVDNVADVIHYLEAFGFKVNGHKSFWTGKFRESCGKEYYDGDDVSIIRLRADVPTSRRDAALIRRFTEFRNRAYSSGLWRTVKVADDILSNLIQIPTRHVLERDAIPANVLALDSVIPNPNWNGRFNPDLQRFERRYPSVRAQPRTYEVQGEGGLLKWFLENNGDGTYHQREFRQSQERAHTFRIKWVWSESLPKLSGAI